MNTYLSSSIIFHNDKITTKLQETFGDMEIPVMMDWEDSLMSASAAYVTQNGGDILEIGFGMGISAGYIHSHSIDSHTIIENHPDIIPKAIEWASNKSNVTIISQSWYDVKDSLGTFDGVFYDTFEDENYKDFSSSLSTWTKSGTKVTFWNDDNAESNNHQIQTSYQQINITPPNSASVYFRSGDTIYYMPMKEF
jgi:predicted O-methyltransferase YrrM